MSDYFAVLSFDGLSVVDSMVVKYDGTLVLLHPAEPNAPTDAYTAWLAAGGILGAPRKISKVIMTGQDAIDVMSDVAVSKSRIRDVMRVAIAPDVREVKSKLKRMADANGMSIADMIPGIEI